jgi:acyl carrier protein
MRTGDLGRWLPDGTIGILGRSDFQIKLNGYRIEAGEVETRLVGVPGIKQAAVTKQTGTHGDRLVAHVVAEGDERKTEDAIRQQLRQHLPEYMIPTLFLWHEQLPLSRNGKVDRQKLIALSDAAHGAAAVAHEDGPLSELEAEVQRIWASVLRIPEAEVVPSVNLADLGGDSLAAVRILTGVRKRFGVGITLDQIFEVDTVRRMAAYVEAAQVETAGPR